MEPAEPKPHPDRDEPAIKLDKRSATKAFAWSVLYAIISKVVFPLVSTVLVSRVLGPSIYGSFALLLTIVNFSEILRDAGLTQTFLADPELDRKKEGSYLTVAIVTGILPAAALVLLGPWLAETFRNPEFRWAIPVVAGVVVVNGLSTIPRAKMLRDGQVKLSGGLDLIGGTLGLGTTVAMVAMGYGFASLVAQMVIAAVYGLAMSWSRYPVRSLHVSWRAFQAVGRKSMAVLAANGLNNLFLLADHTVLNQLAGNAANGFFGQAANFAYKPADLLIFPLTRTLMVAFSQSSVDRDRLARVYARSIGVALISALPIYVFLAFFAEPIILLLLSEKFAGSIPVLQAMCLYLGFRVLGNISGHALVPAGRHSLTLYPWLASLALTSGLLFLVARGKGPFPNPGLMMPIVWSFVAGAVLVYASLLALAMRACPPPAEERRRLRESLAALVISSAAIAVLWALPLPMYVRLALAALLGPVLHFAILGTILAKNPLEYLNPSGPKRLWSTL